MADSNRPDPRAILRDALDRSLEKALADSGGGRAFVGDALDALLRELQSLRPEEYQAACFAAFRDALHRRIDQREDGEDDQGEPLEPDLTTLYDPARGMGFRRAA